MQAEGSDAPRSAASSDREGGNAAARRAVPRPRRSAYDQDLSGLGPLAGERAAQVDREDPQPIRPDTDPQHEWQAGIRPVGGEEGAGRDGCRAAPQRARFARLVTLSKAG